MPLAMRRLGGCALFAAQATALGAASDVQALVQAQVQSHHSAHVTFSKQLGRFVGETMDELMGRISNTVLQMMATAPAAQRTAAQPLQLLRTSGPPVPHAKPAAKPQAVSAAPVRPLMTGDGLNFHIDRKTSSGSKEQTLQDASDGSRQSVAWGDEVNLDVQAHVDSGVKSGDILLMNSTISYYADSGAPAWLLNIMNGRSFFMESRLQVCHGTWERSLVSENGMVFRTVIPTVIQPCTSDASYDMTMANGSFSIPPAPPAEWGLHVSVDMIMAVLGPEGNTKVSNKLAVDVKTPEEVKHKFTFPVKMFSRPPAVSNKFALTLSRGAGGIQAAPEVPAKTPFEAMWRVMSKAALKGLGDIAESASAVAVQMHRQEGLELEEDSAPPANRLKALVVKLQWSKMEGDHGKNFSLKADPGCISPAPNSVDCFLRLGQHAKARTDIHLSAHHEPGASMTANFEVKVGGLLGPVVSKVLPPASFFAPLCGEGGEISYMGSTVPVLAAPCGDYAMDFVLPEFDLATADIPDIKFKDLGIQMFPGLPKSLPELPPVTMTGHFHYRHADMKPMYDLHVEMALVRDEFRK